jgi:hypothetical protein
MQLASEKERDALSDAVSQLLAKLKAKGKGKMGEENVPKPKKPKGASPVELAARKSLLHTNKCDQRPPLHVMGGSRPVHILVICRVNCKTTQSFTRIIHSHGVRAEVCGGAAFRSREGSVHARRERSSCLRRVYADDPVARARRTWRPVWTARKAASTTS